MSIVGIFWLTFTI